MIYLNLVIVFCLPSILFSSEENKTFYPFSVQAHKVHPVLQQVTAIQVQPSMSATTTQHRLHQRQISEEHQSRSENQTAESHEFTPFGYLFDIPVEPDLDSRSQITVEEKVITRKHCHLMLCCCQCGCKEDSEEVNR